MEFGTGYGLLSKISTCTGTGTMTAEKVGAGTGTGKANLRILCTGPESVRFYVLRTLVYT